MGQFKPYERQQALLKLADLVERHFDELSSLDTLDMGAPISRTKGTRLRVLGMLRYYAGQATAIHGETIPNSLPGDLLLHIEGVHRHPKTLRSETAAACARST